MKLSWAIPFLLLTLPAGADENDLPAFRPTRAHQRHKVVRGAREGRMEEIRSLFAGAGLDYPPTGVLMRIFKKEDVLELWVRPRTGKQYIHLKDYAICARSGVLGPKRRRGDGQVPEGFYRVTRFNPISQFHLSMLIDYPNASDRIRGHPRDPGGSILVHGDCVTIGCVPITDRWIEELYLICLDAKWRHGAWPRVHVYPARLDAEGLQALEAKNNGDEDLLAFWRELSDGYQAFEETRVPPRPTVLKTGAYRFRPGKGGTRKP